MKLPFKHLIHLAAALAVMIFAANIVSACKCGEKAKVEEEFTRSWDVVILRLESIGENNMAYLTVEKVFKGNLTPGKEVVIRQVREQCLYIFSKDEIGGSFLFYLGSTGMGDPVGMAAHICSRSAPVASAALDIQYLETLFPGRVKSRIQGKVTKQVTDPADPENVTYVPLPGHGLRLSSNQLISIKIKTDAEGNYEFTDIPPGKYKIFAELIDGFRFKEGKGSPTFDVLEIELTAGGQVRQDIQFFPRLPKAPDAEPGHSNPN